VADRRSPGGVHVTDVSNASRTMLMNLRTLDWDADILKLMGVPRAMLPAIRPSSAVYGEANRDLDGIPGPAIWATSKRRCLARRVLAPARQEYLRYRLLYAAQYGHQMVPSKSGLLTTVGYKIGDNPAVYCLEGSIAITGALVQWLRDNLGLIAKSSDVEALARTVDDNGGMYFVPAFSGLFAPHWRADARV